ncbi:hypothetical protein BDW68DRAFT_178410 [Aspergillus falconensis]
MRGENVPFRVNPSNPEQRVYHSRRPHRNLEILRHFQDIFTPNTMIISETGKDVMRGKIIRLALQSPYLMHSLIGVAIAHRRCVLPDDDGNYTLLEAHHWQHAIRQYSAELQLSIGPKTWTLYSQPVCS